MVRLQGSMEGQVIVPQSVTIPAGSISATFTTTPAPETPFPRWVFIQGSYGTSGGLQARILEIDPAPGPATVLAIGPASQDVIGGHSGRASVALVIPAQRGGVTGRADWKLHMAGWHKLDIHHSDCFGVHEHGFRSINSHAHC